MSHELLCPTLGLFSEDDLSDPPAEFLVGKEAIEPVVKIDDRGQRAIVHRQGLRPPPLLRDAGERRGGCLLEESPVPSPPPIDGLFDVTHIKEAPPCGQALLEQGEEGLPLGAARILEFVDEEMTYPRPQR